MKKLLFTLTLSVALALGSQSAFAQAKKKLTEKIADGATTAVEATKAAGKAASDTIKGKSAEAAKPAEAGKEKTTKSRGFYISADEIDASGKAFTHANKKDGKKVKYVVAASAEIMNEGKPAKFEDIKVGDYVSGTLTPKSETENEVVKISKFGPKAPKAPDAKKPEAKPEAKPKK